MRFIIVFVFCSFMGCVDKTKEPPNECFQVKICEKPTYHEYLAKTINGQDLKTPRDYYIQPGRYFNEYGLGTITIDLRCTTGSIIVLIEGTTGYKEPPEHVSLNYKNITLSSTFFINIYLNLPGLLIITRGFQTVCDASRGTTRGI